MWRKTESHILHGFRYFSQTHLYCRITYSQFLMLNFETDLHFCVCNQCPVPQVDQVRQTNDAKLMKSLSVLLFPFKTCIYRFLQLSVSDAALSGVPYSQLWHQFIELEK